MEGGGNTPPPVLHQPKKPGANRVNVFVTLRMVKKGPLKAKLPCDDNLNYEETGIC